MKETIRRITPPFILDIIGRYRFVQTTKSFSEKPGYSVFKLVRWICYEWIGRDIAFTTPDGTRFFSTPRNYSSFIVYFADYRDPSIHAFLQKRLKRGSLFIDAGANVGTYTVRAGQIVGPEGRVVAIEAYPYTYDYLLKNIKLNNLKNVTPINVALGAERGTIEISYNPSNAGETHIAVGTEKKINVPVKTLDGVMQELSIPHADYLKIDVEGFEYALLEGSRNIIANSPNIVIQTELDDHHSRRYGHPITKVIDLLFDWGLSPHEVNAKGDATKIEKSSLKTPCDILWWRE